ncbi:MAG TPA: efflux RND transporter periplasmic adaptor subunit [Steroidobacteraceae bacterium]|nr:efflux RND transporter periplasmic adaptor subunit [Steroidobacteraceae bacterium]
MNPFRLKSYAAAALAPVILIAAGVVFAVTHDGQGDSQGAAGAPPPPAVSVAKVVEREFQPWDEFTGRIAAVETVELRPRVSGYIERVAYEEGHEVRKGDLLFVIDQRRYRAALDRAVAEFQRARSEARLAATELERAETLLAAKAISREEFDARRAANVQGDATVRAAAAAVDTARLDLQFTEVRSPIDGRAGRALVTVGNLAQADSTLLTTLVSLDPMYVYFEADEQTFLDYSAAARRGEHRTTSSPVRVGLANETGFPHPGTVDFVDNQVDARTGTIRARAVVPNADRSLTPGLFARVQLGGGRRQSALLIDEKAVLTDQDRKYVYVLGPNDVAVRKDIVLGRKAGDLRVVDRGLEPGETVIVHGVQRVFFAGMPVAPQEIAMGDAAPDALRMAANKPSAVDAS